MATASDPAEYVQHVNLATKSPVMAAAGAVKHDSTGAVSCAK